MLTGKLVRVKHARNRLVPQYLDPTNSGWLALAEQLVRIFRDMTQHSRAELEEVLADVVGEGPGQLVHQGLAKLLEDRCEFEVVADVAPETVREVVYKIAANQHTQPQLEFDRQKALEEAARHLSLSAEQVESALLADLKDEQRILKFEDISPLHLLHRYNVALAQAILLRSTSVELRVWSETPARFRQLFRSMKFHRLICQIHQSDDHGYRISLDGPLSLFSSTNKYGLQLALFLPSVLHCKAFDLRADVKWGADKKAKTFVLSASDGLKSHLPDFGVSTPRELQNFYENFKNNISDWLISDEPAPIPLGETIWIPDYKLTHTPTGKEVFVELLGFWRKVNLEQHYKRLKKAIPGQFLLAIADSFRTDEEDDFSGGVGVYKFKRTPIASEVAKLAASL
jgi:uncharacterized protein